jgi:hypothetical protein
MLYDEKPQNVLDWKQPMMQILVLTLGIMGLLFCLDWKQPSSRKSLDKGVYATKKCGELYGIRVWWWRNASVAMT